MNGKYCYKCFGSLSNSVYGWYCNYSGCVNYGLVTALYAETPLKNLMPFSNKTNNA